MESEPARVKALREAVRIAPGDAGLRRLLGDALLEHGDAAGAIAEFRECLGAAPHDPDLLLALATAYGKAGKPRAALAALDDLLERTGDSAPAFLQKARLHAEIGEVPAAVTAYRAAITADPRLIDLEFATQLGVDAAEAEGEAWPATLPADEPAAPDGRAGRSMGPGRPGDELDVPDRDDPDGGRVRADPGRVAPDAPPVELERPRITFADVGGMDAVKEEIRLKIIHPIEHAELFAAYGKAVGGGILLYGPPGCGKTHLARATAGEVRATFLAVGISDVLEMWFGQSERNLHQVFEEARNHQPSVLFFDEVDALAANRRDFSGTTGRNVVNVFLSELDGIDNSNDGVLILAATNAPWHLDPAFRRPGRFDRVIFVPPPDASARSAILRVMLAGKPVGNVDHDEVARRTEHFSGADLKGLVDTAIEAKLGEAIRAGIPTPLSTRDLVEAAKRVVPSTREWFATARNYVLYANQSGLYDAVRPYLRL
jgi:transitional endoplasmic reticulum ATPase